MHRYYCSPSVRVLEITMTAFLPELLKPYFGQSSNNLPTRTRAISSYSDSLNPDKLEVTILYFTFNLKTQRNGFPHPFYQLVQGLSLSMTTLKLRNRTDKIPIFVSFKNH